MMEVEEEHEGYDVMPSNEGCVCPICGYKASHWAGVPCSIERCPKCGAVMTCTLTISEVSIPGNDEKLWELIHIGH